MAMIDPLDAPVEKTLNSNTENSVGVPHGHWEPVEDAAAKATGEGVLGKSGVRVKTCANATCNKFLPANSKSEYCRHCYTIMVRRGAIKPMRGRPVQALDAEGGFIEEDRADKLDRVTDLALDHYEAVLRDKVPKRSARYLELVRAKNDAAGNILRTTVRVDQNKLRKGTHDRLGSLLQKIERVEKGLPAIIEGEAKEA